MEGLPHVTHTHWQANKWRRVQPNYSFNYFCFWGHLHFVNLITEGCCLYPAGWLKTCEQPRYFCCMWEDKQPLCITNTSLISLPLMQNGSRGPGRWATCSFSHHKAPHHLTERVEELAGHRLPSITGDLRPAGTAGAVTLWTFDTSTKQPAFSQSVLWTYDMSLCPFHQRRDEAELWSLCIITTLLCFLSTPPLMSPAGKTMSKAIISK